MSTKSSLDAAFGKSLQLIFPPVAVQLLNALLEPDTSFSVISDYLAMDPVLSGRVLHIANSPAVGLSAKATSLEQAARILGINELFKLAVSLGLQKRLQPVVPRDPEALYADWRLTVWSAIAAQALADRLCPPLRQQAYLAAMLKDLPLFLAFCRRDLPPFLDKDAMALLPSPAQAEAERAFWGKDHPELAHDIAVSWDFPESLAGALRLHHCRTEAETLPPFSRCLIHATRWAEILHNPQPDPAQLIAFELTLKTLLGLSGEEMTALRARCADRFNAMLDQLGVSRSGARFRLYEHSFKDLRNMHFLALAASGGGAPASISSSLQSQLRIFWGISSWDAYIRPPGEASGFLFRCRSNSLAPEVRLAPADAAAPPGWKVFPFSPAGAASGFLALPEGEASSPETLPLFAHMLGQGIKSPVPLPQESSAPPAAPSFARADPSGIVREASRPPFFSPEELMAVLDERVCLLKDSGVIFWDFSGDASLAGKNIFSVSRPDASFTAPWEPALLAGLEKPLRLNAVLLSGKDTSTPCALTFSPLRGSEGKRFLLIIHGADSVPAAGGQRQEDQRDSLTGLYSHSRFHLILEEEAEEARKTGASMGILYCDLNNFRRINEQYGYLAGDALLTRLADCFTAVPDNETRFACRYEGDDFVLLIPRANAALLESTARDLDRRVRRISREALSIRIGLALIVPGQAPVARMHMARAACGRAKITRKPFFWSG